MVSPALAVLPASTLWRQTWPTSMVSLGSELPLLPVSLTCASAASASSGVLPVRSGTVTVAAGSGPFEIVKLITVPSGNSRPWLGFWSTT